MNKGKKLTAVVAAAATTAAMVAPAFAADASSFTDIDGSYAKDAITSLVAKGIIHGVDATHFNPTAKITREDFSIILANALGLDVSSAPATPSFSDLPTTHYAYKYVEALHKAGIISGVSATEFGTGANITRQDMAALYVRALGVDVTGKASTLTFADKDQIASYAQDAVGYAVEAGLFHGMDATHFAPTANATREQVALVAAKFLDVKASLATAKLTSATYVDANTLTLNFDKAVDSLAASDVSVVAKATGSAVNVSGVTLSADKKSATVKVATLVAGTTYTVKVGDNSVDVTSTATPAVASVTALNLKQVQVTFTAPVDETTAEAMYSYTLSGSGIVNNDGNTVSAFDKTANTGDTAALQADGKTVIITLAGQRHLQNQGSYSLTVSGVKDASGNTINDATDKFTPFDNAVPVAKEVDVLGPNTLQVLFSAPISAANYSNFTLDNGTVSVTVPAGAQTISGNTYAVTLNIGTTLTDGAHTLEVNGAAGFNGLKSNDQTLSFNYQKDTTAPTVAVTSTALAANNTSSVVFKFSKPVAYTAAGSSLSVTNGNFYAMYDAIPNYAGTVSAVDTNAKTYTQNGITYADTFDVTFNTLLPVGTATFYVDNTDADHTIQDAWSNSFANASVTAPVAVDTAKPTISSIKAVSQNEVDVTFSKDVDLTTAKYQGNYTFYAADGTLLTGTANGLDNAGHPLSFGTYDSTNHILQITGLNLPAGTVKVAVANIKDTAVPNENVMDNATVNVSVGDSLAPAVSQALYSSDEQSLYVYFNKALDPSVITNIHNYQIGSKLLSDSAFSGVSLTPINGNTAVKITFPSPQAAYLQTGTTLYYNGLVDANGNYQDAVQKSVTLAPDHIDAQNDIDANYVTATATDTVTFEVQQPLSGIVASDITYGGTQVVGAYYVNQKVEGGTKNGALVTVKLPVSVSGALYGNASNFQPLVVNAGALINANGNDMNGNRTLTVAADGIAPTIATRAKEYDTATATHHIKDILVTFSEPMLDSTIGLSSFTVAGYSIADVQPVDAGNKSTAFRVVLNENSYDDTAYQPTVTLVKDAQDANGNVIKAETTGKAAQ